MPLRLRPLPAPNAKIIVGVAAVTGLVLASTSAVAAATSPAAVETTIPALQGAAHLSPLAGQAVSTTGVVTARKFDGYWIQDAAGDGDATTSDAVYVFAGASGAKPEVGQSVDVTGTVTEFRPSSRTGPNLSLTEIERASFTVLDDQAALPPPVRIGPGGRLAPAQNADSSPTRVDVETTGDFRPSRDAVDFYETLESMRVELGDAKVVGPSNAFGELVVVPAGSSGLPRTRAGGVRYASYATPHTRRITVDDEIIFRQMPSANVGDTLAGPVTGPLAYNFGMFRIFPTEVPTVRPGGLAKESTRPALPRELSVASFNVENLDPTDPAATFDRLAATVVDHLAAPDVLALEEVQDDTGAECPDGPTPTCTPDGVVDADQTLGRLASAIAAAGGPAYEWRQISPVNLADGGEPTGNIRVAFLFRTDRGLRFVDRRGGDATTPTGVREGPHGRAELTLSPGRIAPQDAAWAASRKPLAAEFTFRGRTVFVVANHFNSKSGDEPIMGRWQPPARSSEVQRHAQAHLVHDFVADILAVQKDADVVVVGDFNDFEFSETAAILQGDRASGGGVLVSLPMLLPRSERYSYVFDGNSQVLDQMFVSPGLLRPSWHRPLPALRGYDIVHVNAEFADQASDHDPQVVRLAP